MSEPWDGYIPGFDPPNMYMFGGGTLPQLVEDQSFDFSAVPMGHQWPGQWSAHGAVHNSPVTQRQYPNSQFAGATSDQHIVSPIEQLFHGMIKD